MIHFERRAKRMPELPLVPLIDVVFILIVFFMLTTNFMQYESMELKLPAAGSAKISEARDVVRVFVHDDGRTTFGERQVDAAELERTLKALFAKDAQTKVVLFSAESVSVQKLVSVMDMVYLAGGRSLFVKRWQPSAGNGE